MDLDFYVFDNYRDTIKEFEGKIVDIQCRLLNENLDLSSLLDIQFDLIDLIESSMDFKLFFYETVKPEFEEEANKMLKSPLSRENAKITFAFLEEIAMSIRVLFGNINRRKAYLNKKILEFAGKESKEQDGLYAATYYEANGRIVDYLCGEEIDYNKLNVNTEIAMIVLLQREFNSKSRDLDELLKLEKQRDNNRLVLKYGKEKVN